MSGPAANPLLEAALNLAAFHKQHERFYASSPLESALRLQRHARALLGLEDAGRQEDLAAVFDTSRIPVREALRVLEYEGLVASEPHRGFTVTSLDAEQIDELEHSLNESGTIVAKKPDVWGESRLTKHRQQVEDELDA